MALKIGIADDHAVVASGARMLLEAATDHVIAFQASTPDELFDQLRTHDCDLVITDFSMPGSDLGDGLELVDVLARDWAQIVVVVLTQLSNVPIYEQLLKRPNVKSLVHKSDAAEELVKAVAKASRGLLYLSKHVGLQISRDVADPARGNKLSNRELQVLRLFVAGNSVTEIGALLSSSIKTVSAQKIQAMRKIGALNDADLYVFARENGLLT